MLPSDRVIPRMPVGKTEKGTLVETLLSACQALADVEDKLGAVESKFEGSGQEPRKEEPPPCGAFSLAVEIRNKALRLLERLTALNNQF